MKKFTLIRSEVVPTLFTSTVEIEAESLKEAIELVVDGEGEILYTSEEPVDYAYNIAKYDNTSTIKIWDLNNKLLYNDNDTFAYGYNPYKCFE